jgi:LacI family transcriptional regulator
MRHITINDIAKAINVSGATVSRALNGVKGVSDSQRRFIVETADKMGYKPNAIARSLVMKHSNTIALIVPDISNPYTSDIALSITETANTHGYDTLLCNTSWNSENEARQLALMMEKRVDGIIIKSSNPQKFNYEKINVPVVFIGHTYGPRRFSNVEVENEAGAYMAVEHIIRCGYRRIAYIGGILGFKSCELRLEGYMRAHREYGLTVDEALISNGNYTMQSGYDFMDTLLKLPNVPDAAFCTNDLMALGVWQRVEEAGIMVPQDFGIVGFDDVFFSSLPQIQLTSISQSRKEMGDIAANLLIDSIHSPNNKKIITVSLPSKLIIRKSTRKYKE